MAEGQPSQPGAEGSSSPDSSLASLQSDQEPDLNLAGRGGIHIVEGDMELQGQVVHSSVDLLSISGISGALPGILVQGTQLKGERLDSSHVHAVAVQRADAETADESVTLGSVYMPKPSIKASDIHNVKIATVAFDQRKKPVPSVERKLSKLEATTRQLIATACPQGYVETPALSELLQGLQQQGACLVLGVPGHGKTALALQAMGSLAASHNLKPLRLERPEQWGWISEELGDTDNGEQIFQQRGNLEEAPSRLSCRANTSEGPRGWVVLLDDVFGKSDCHGTEPGAWGKILDALSAKVSAGVVKAVITSRAHVYEERVRYVHSHPLFSGAAEIDLREPQFWTRDVMEEILQTFLLHHNVRLTSPLEDFASASEKCTDVGYPQCCKYFATSAAAREEGPRFFRHPVGSVLGQLRALQKKDAESHLVLVLAALQGGTLHVEAASSNTTRLSTLSRKLGLEEAMTKADLEIAADKLCEVYLREEEDEEEGGVFRFAHQSLQDCVVVALCDADLELALEVCSIQQLCEYVHTEGSSGGHAGLTYKVHKTEWPLLAARLVKAMTSEELPQAVRHPSLKDPGFMSELVAGHLEPSHISQILRGRCNARIEVPRFAPTCSLFRECTASTTTTITTTASSTARTTTTAATTPNTTTSTTTNSATTTITTTRAVAALIARGVPELPGVLLASEQLSGLSREERHPLLKEALVCACRAGDASLVRLLLLDKDAAATVDALRAACASEEDDVSTARCVRERLGGGDDEALLTPEVWADLLWSCCERGKGGSLRHLLSEEARPRGDCQRELDAVVTELLLRTRSSRRGGGDDGQLHPHHRSNGSKNSTSYNSNSNSTSNSTSNSSTSSSSSNSGSSSSSGLPSMLSALIAAGARVSSCKMDLRTAAGLPDSVALRELLSGTTPPPGENWRRGTLQGTLLHESAKCGSVACAKFLLTSPQTSSLDINALDEEERSPLHRAVEGNHLAVAEFLLQHGADPHGGVRLHDDGKADDSGRSREGAGRHVTAGSRDIQAVCEGTTPLHLASRHHRLSLMELLIRHKARTDVLDENRRTPLHAYASGGGTRSRAGGGEQTDESLRRRVETLLAESTEDVNQQDREGATALHLAVAKGLLSFTETLLSHGARTDVVDERRRTVLHVLASLGDRSKEAAAGTRMLSLLVRGRVHIDPEDDQLRTPPHVAAENNNLDVMEALLERGARLDSVDRRKRSVLHAYLDRPCCCNVRLTARRRRVEEAILASMTDIDSPDSEGRTPLHLAARCGHVAMIEKLLQRQARVDVRDKEGRTPLHWYALSGRRLRTHKSKWQSELRRGAEKLFIETTATTRAAAKNGINAQDNDGKTTLHIAASRRDLSLIETLIQHGARADLMDCHGRTPVHWYSAASGDRPGCSRDPRLRRRVEELMVGRMTPPAGKERQAGVVNAQDRNGRTALHLAAQRGQLLLARQLLKRGARVDLGDNAGMTALHWFAWCPTYQQRAASSAAAAAAAAAAVAAAEILGRRLVESCPPEVCVAAALCGCTPLRLARERGKDWLVRALESRAPSQAQRRTEWSRLDSSSSSCSSHGLLTGGSPPRSSTRSAGGWGGPASAELEPSPTAEAASSERCRACSLERYLREGREGEEALESGSVELGFDDDADDDADADADDDADNDVGLQVGCNEADDCGHEGGGGGGGGDRDESANEKIQDVVPTAAAKQRPRIGNDAREIDGRRSEDAFKMSKFDSGDGEQPGLETRGCCGSSGGGSASRLLSLCFPRWRAPSLCARQRCSHAK